MKITQRTATLKDAPLILTWRNHPSTREFLPHSTLIENNEHSRWFSARLERLQLEPFLLFEVDHEVVGISRLDLVLEFTDKYEISILVDPKQHGNGIGTKILDMTCKDFFRSHPNKSIIARVHSQNIASQRLFVSAGFLLRSSEGAFLNFERS
jgi:RimJ/RimL family protein N-acetyltransferase